MATPIATAIAIRADRSSPFSEIAGLIAPLMRSCETADEIAARLARDAAKIPADVAKTTIVNDGTVADGIARIVEVLRGN
mgnify:CR=1 FL=1